MLSFPVDWPDFELRCGQTTSCPPWLIQLQLQWKLQHHFWEGLANLYLAEKQLHNIPLPQTPSFTHHWMHPHMHYTNTRSRHGTNLRHSTLQLCTQIIMSTLKTAATQVHILHVGRACIQKQPWASKLILQHKWVMGMYVRTNSAWGASGKGWAGLYIATG